jgi:hypothetical protein
LSDVDDPKRDRCRKKRVFEYAVQIVANGKDNNVARSIESTQLNCERDLDANGLTEQKDKLEPGRAMVVIQHSME